MIEMLKLLFQPVMRDSDIKLSLQCELLNPVPQTIDFLLFMSYIWIRWDENKSAKVFQPDFSVYIPFFYLISQLFAYGENAFRGRQLSCLPVSTFLSHNSSYKLFLCSKPFFPQYIKIM